MKRYFSYINILVLPTDLCNMNCVYCFHKDFHTTKAFMDLNTLENLMKITIPYYDRVGFIWHGGEPLAMGLDFYKEVIRLQNKYKQDKGKITNRMQTNLTLMDRETAEFLVANGFGTGSSFDGIQNDETRGNSDEILAGRDLLLDCGGKCGVISVVSGMNVNTLIESYEFCKARKLDYTLNMFIRTGDNEANDKLELSGERYVQKVTELFDYWFYDRDCNININYFNTFLNYILGRKKTLCNFTSCLGKWVGVRYNGDITPCNRYFPEQYTYGNVNELTDIGQAFESEGFRLLLTQAIERRDKCKTCKIYDFCNGGCNNIALHTNGVENNGGIFCETLIELYSYIEEKANLVDTELYPKLNPYVQKIFQKYRPDMITACS